jgi:hypothetical protein
MGDLFTNPFVLPLSILIFLCIPVIFYLIGFRNGVRKGQLVELQKQLKRQD